MSVVKRLMSLGLALILMAAMATVPVLAEGAVGEDAAMTAIGEPTMAALGDSRQSSGRQRETAVEQPEQERRGQNDADGELMSQTERVWIDGVQYMPGAKGDGWSYAMSGYLVLEGFTGTSIRAEGDLSIELYGDNLINANWLEAPALSVEGNLTIMAYKSSLAIYAWAASENPRGSGPAGRCRSAI